MSTPQSLSVTTANIQSNVIASTKIRVTVGANPVFYAVGVNPTAVTTGTCELLPAESVRYINMQGLNNIIAFVSPSGTSNVSVTTIGTVSPSSVVLGNVYR